MSIMLSNYIETNHLTPVVPSWFRMERYDYCDRMDKSAVSPKRSIFSSRSSKKSIKK